jgi:hypothetical protein
MHPCLGGKRKHGCLVIDGLGSISAREAILQQMGMEEKPAAVHTNAFCILCPVKQTVKGQKRFLSMIRSWKASREYLIGNTVGDEVASFVTTQSFMFSIKASPETRQQMQDR